VNEHELRVIVGVDKVLVRVATIQVVSPIEPDRAWARTKRACRTSIVVISCHANTLAASSLFLQRPHQPNCHESGEFSVRPFAAFRLAALTCLAVLATARTFHISRQVSALLSAAMACGGWGDVAREDWLIFAVVFDLDWRRVVGWST